VSRIDFIRADPFNRGAEIYFHKGLKKVSPTKNKTAPGAKKTRGERQNILVLSAAPMPPMSFFFSSTFNNYTKYHENTHS